MNMHLQLILWSLPVISLIVLIAGGCVFVCKLRSLNRAAQEEPTFMGRIRDYVHEADLESAKTLCNSAPDSTGAVFAKGLGYIGRPLTETNTMMSAQADLEIRNASKGIFWMWILAAAAYLLYNICFPIAVYLMGVWQIPHEMVHISQDMWIWDASSYGAALLLLIGYGILLYKKQNLKIKLDGRRIDFINLLNEPIS